MTQFIETKLGDITELISRGITPSYSNSGVIIINQKCIREGKVSLDQSRLTDPIKKKIREDKFLRSFDILINSTGQGTLGRVSQFKEVTYPITVDSHVTIVRAKSEVDSVFLGYILKSKQPQIEALAEGSTGQTELSRNKLAEIDISLPPLPTQKAIAEILSSLDDKIELNNQINQNLEALAQALFKQWFVDFEFPNENGEPYKSSGGEMIDSELGEIPKGWEVHNLESIAKLIRGISYRKHELVTKEEGLPFVNLKCFALDGTFRQDGIKYYNGKFKDSHLIQSNDILVAVTDITQDRLVIGLPIIWQKNELALPSLDVCLIRPTNRNLKEYLYYEFKTHRYKSRIIEFANGSTVLHLSVKGLETYQLSVPTESILIKWRELVNPILTKIENNIRLNQNLSSLRDTLLPKLISGELEVSEANLESTF